MVTPVKVRKKLIEVALPLEAISKASAREKSIRFGSAVLTNVKSLDLTPNSSPIASKRISMELMGSATHFLGG